MSSALKTLELLSYFSQVRPEIGLSQLCRLAHRDKATTYRHLQSLEASGFIEQNPSTKQYRLGPAILQLARTRELTVPRTAGAEAPLTALADATHETAHVSVLSGETLYSLASRESSKHSIRVHIDVPALPLHATASGLCALAFGPSELMDAARRNMAAFTEHTVTDVPTLEAAIAVTKTTGFGQSDRTMEQDVYSLATPIYDQTGVFAGAVSVASVASRITPTNEANIRQHLQTASRQITLNWGGVVPAALESRWATAERPENELEATS